MTTDIHTLIGAYALDAVTDDERRPFQHHLRACPACRDELAGLRETAALLARPAPMAPPARLQQSVLTQITMTRPLPPILPPENHHQHHHHHEAARWGQSQRDQSGVPDGLDDVLTRRAADHETPTMATRRERSVRRWLAAVAAAAALTTAGLACHPWTGSRSRTATAIQHVLHAPDAHHHVTHRGDATATVTYSPAAGTSVLQARNMAPAPAGHTYQLWYLTRAGHARPAGYLTPARQKTTTVLLAGHADQAAAINITLEPVGGSDQPTTAPIMTITLPT